MTMTNAERHTTEAEEAAKAAEIRTWEAEAAAARWADSAEVRESANRVATELTALLAGKLYLDDDGNFATIPEEPEAAAACTCEAPEFNACEACEAFAEALDAFVAIEPATLYDWLETCLDVEIYSRDGELHHVDVLVCYGGPTCWIMGKYGNVVYTHGWDTAEVFVYGLADALVDACEGLA